MKYLPGYEALSGEAIASARTLLGQERPTPRAAARIGRKLWDRGYRRSDGGQYQQAPVLRALKARQWTHVITPPSSALMASATVEQGAMAASAIPA
jgi:hypothetical protein